MYLGIKALNNHRRKMKIWESEYLEHYVTEDILIYQRGDMYIAVSNSNGEEVTG